MLWKRFESEKGWLGGAVGPAGEQLNAAAEVVAQVHHTDLIFISDQADTPVINTPERLFHEGKGVFDPSAGLGLALVGQLLRLGQWGRRTAFFVDVIIHAFRQQIRRDFAAGVSRVRVRGQVSFSINSGIS